MKRRIPILLATLALLTQAGAFSGTPEMPLCQSGQPAPTSAPDAPPTLKDPGTCRAKVTAMQKSAPVPSPGYHHLGATTASSWSGVIARLQVGDPAVRADTYDFLASRLMAKADTPDGIEWLEAGWTETGWAGDGKQRIYTYDTNRDAWVFYDQYEIKTGDKVWIFIQTENDAPVTTWTAWIWWGDKWNLLTSQELPLTGRAKIEQYVEVHSEKPFNVPQLRVDSVSLKDGATGPLIWWDAQVPTTPGSSADGYCLNWINKYDTWTAGSCPAP